MTSRDVLGHVSETLTASVEQTFREPFPRDVLKLHTMSGEGIVDLDTNRM